jgi:acetolactate synthase-1/2/3 large subunit
VERNGARIITTLLERQGVTTVAGIPGGANLPLYDALRESRIRHVLARHEQGAGFIAQGVARATGRAGVCLATSGPGATNLLTAVADARLDSVPIVAITGQVPSGLLGTDAFQEVDTYGLTLPITKHNFLVRRPEELLEVIPEAFRLALSGRPGPVAIDVPKDVQTGSVSFEAWPAPAAADPLPGPDPAGVPRLAEMIRRAERPVLYAGGGVIAASAARPLTALARANDIPVACTLAGLGAYPPDDPLFLGMLGMHGARATNAVLEEADLLIVAGARFDDRATGRVADFCRRAAVAHIDIDPAEIGKVRAAELSLAGDVGACLVALLPLVPGDRRLSWRRRIDEIRARFPLREPPADDPLFPPRLLRLLGATAPEGTVFTTDVGQHQMWTAQFYKFIHPRTWLNSGGLGTMGYGFPAALGAQRAFPDKPVVCITGDGSFQMNLQELATAMAYDLPVKVAIINNGYHGMVRQWQQMFYQGHYSASRLEGGPDYVKLAEAYGAVGLRATEPHEVEEVLEEAFAVRKLVLMDFQVDPFENCYPMVPAGGAINQMIYEDLPATGDLRSQPQHESKESNLPA